MAVTTISFVHSGDRNLVITLTSNDVLGRNEGEITSSRKASGWDQVWGLVRQPLTPEGAAALGVPATGYEELFAFITALEPNEQDDWATYLFEVRANEYVGEPLGIVGLNELYEVVHYWRLPYDATLLESLN
jgi:hypothetical protein